MQSRSPECPRGRRSPGWCALHILLSPISRMLQASVAGWMATMYALVQGVWHGDCCKVWFGELADLVRSPTPSGRQHPLIAAGVAGKPVAPVTAAATTLVCL